MFWKKIKQLELENKELQEKLTNLEELIEDLTCSKIEYFYNCPVIISKHLSGKNISYLDTEGFIENWNKRKGYNTASYIKRRGKDD